MRARRKPLRLELHRMRFERDGRRGPLLWLGQLDPAEKELIQQDLRAARSTSVDADERAMARTQAAVLGEWGVMCPHPSGSLDPIGKLKRRGVKDGRPTLDPVCKCDACGAAVFPQGWRIDLIRILTGK